MRKKRRKTNSGKKPHLGAVGDKKGKKMGEKGRKKQRRKLGCHLSRGAETRTKHEPWKTPDERRRIPKGISAG